MANDFSKDTNCIAVWNFNDGALTTDSKGSNTLTDNNTVGQSADCKEGNRSADFTAANSEYLSIVDASLDVLYPLKSGDAIKKISLCCWIKLKQNIDHFIYSKYNSTTNKRSFAVLLTSGNILQIAQGYNSGLSVQYKSFGTAIANDQWYFIGVTYDDSDKSYRIRILNDAGSPVGADAVGTFDNNISVSDAQVCIGTRSDPSNYFDGYIDELSVFNDILIPEEIDLIRAGSYFSYGNWVRANMKGIDLKSGRNIFLVGHFREG